MTTNGEQEVYYVRPRVYVSGPYTLPDPETNVKQSIKVGLQLVRAGFAPLVPHLTHFMEAIESLPYHDWLEVDLSWVETADAVLRLPGESNGADIEERVAMRADVPIYYSVEDLQKAFAGWEAVQEAFDTRPIDPEQAEAIKGDTRSDLDKAECGGV